MPSTGKYNPGIVLTPVLTVWNPYSVEISVDQFAVLLQETAPISFDLKVAGAVLPKVSLSDISGVGQTGYWRFIMSINAPLTLAPGATKIFSCATNRPVVNTPATFINIILTPGYRPGGGVLFTNIKKLPAPPGGNEPLPQEVQANAADTFSVDKITYDAQTLEDVS